MSKAFAIFASIVAILSGIQTIVKQQAPIYGNEVTGVKAIAVGVIFIALGIVWIAIEFVRHRKDQK